MAVAAPLFQLDNRDYNFTLIQARLELHEKPKQPEKKERAYLVASRLTQLLTTLHTQNRALNPETKATISLFLLQLRVKVNAALSRQHPYSALLYKMIQRIFCCGALSALGRAEAALDRLKIREQEAIVLAKIDLEEKERSALTEKHAALIELFELPPCKNEALLVDALKAALLRSDLKTKLHKKSLPKVSVDLLCVALQKEAGLLPIYRRFQQIVVVKFENEGIDPVEQLRMAFFIESIHKVGRVKNAFFHASKSTLVRHVQLDAAAHDVYILANPAASLLKEEEKDSTFKRVQACVQFPAGDYKLPPEVAACLTTKTEELQEDCLDDATFKEIVAGDIKNTRVEVEFCHRYRGIRGLAQFRTSASYKDGDVPHCSLIFTRRTGNLQRLLFNSERSLSFAEIVTVAKDLAHGLNYMHQHKTIHADIKLPNALFNENEKGVIVSGELCDFGLTFEMKDQTSKLRLPIIFRFGHSGVVGLTAPEFYGKTDFKGSYYSLDIWSLGCVYYQLFHRREPSWKKAIDTHVAKNFDGANMCYKNPKRLETTQAKLQEHVTAEIETRYEELAAKKPAPKSKECFELLFLKMMRLDPTKRIASAQLVEEIEAF